MVSSADLVSYLPRLRRYARALCGSRQAGDDLVLATIRDLDWGRTISAANPLVFLFRQINEQWETRSRIGPQQATVVSVAEMRILALPPLKRQAFLLVALEDFSCQEAGRILSRDPDELAHMIAETETAIARDIATDVLIIEDDRFVSEDLARIMNRIGHDVFAVARTRQEAISYARVRHPGLILCDLRLADGSSGLTAVNEINPEGRAPVLFITGNQDDMHHAASSAGEFLIPKPYSAREVRKVASRALLCHVPHPL